ncbi:uncharacterized protein LOC131530130 [Onychostoma macrolepis]|uniref:uncharacterized protein LOC131530130 n=1 Tax=Onychostoma macrolepis TaxID=369639 RepID=UPI00272C28C4|nr:uncharacterized protein LOC131530130 [Onychostoma macrolepis]
MNLFIFIPVWVLQLGVFVDDVSGVSVSVMEGDSVTLITDVKTNQQEKIKCFFNDTRIAQISDYLDVPGAEMNETQTNFFLGCQLPPRATPVDPPLLVCAWKTAVKVVSLFIFVPVWGLQPDVSGVDSDGESVSVMEGDSVTLHTDVKTNQQEKIKWFFSDTRIAQISDYLSKTCTDVQCNKGTERFRDRLKLDHQTGSLTITNTRTTDSGVYKLQMISSRSISEKIFRITVHDVPGAEMNKTQTKSVKEGESVTLDSGVMKNPKDLMTWYFNDTLIAKINGDPSRICTDDQCENADVRFRNRLKLNHQTGSLTIMNPRTTDSGLYHLEIITNSSSIRRRHIINIVSQKGFSVPITDHVVYFFAIAGICVGVLLVVAGEWHRKCTYKMKCPASLIK